MDFETPIHVLEGSREFRLTGVAVGNVPNGIAGFAEVEQGTGFRFRHDASALIVAKCHAIIQAHYRKPTVRGRVDDFLSLLIVVEGRKGWSRFSKVDFYRRQTALADGVEKSHVPWLGHEQQVLSPFIRTEHGISGRWQGYLLQRLNPSALK